MTNHAIFKHPGIIFSLILLLWVGLSTFCLFIPVKWAEIPVGVWIWTVGGLMGIGFCLYSIFFLKEW